jgi:hypothetical protein
MVECFELEEIPKNKSYIVNSSTSSLIQTISVICKITLE